MPFDLAKSVTLLPEERQPRVKQRIELVVAAQRRLGMEPRNDSQLTWSYAIGALDDDHVPSAIANELLTVDLIFNTTPYATIIEDALREIAHHIKYKYKLSWTDTWDITRFYGPSMLKLYCYNQRASSS